VACAVIGGLLGGILGAVLSDDGDGSSPTALPVPVPGPSSGRVSAPGSLADLVARVSPAVVSIRSTSGSSGFGIGQGTGVILTPDGDVLTNAHVVSDAETVKVVIPGQARAQSADIIGVDEDEDVAVIRIRDAALLPVAEIGNSNSLRLAEEVFAIGHALGLNGGPSVTRGIVSGLDRSNGPLAGLIQTDAALNPGNSGGPLFDGAGRVVGINTMVRSGAENVGFAIPIERAVSIAGRLRSGQPAPAKALLGVTSQAPDDGSSGAEVVKVSEGEPAAKAGLRPGDRITAVNGKPVTGPAGLAILVGDRSPGEVVEFTYQRGDEEKTVDIELATRN
jgi:S1-C subfamily serine protease